MQQAGYISGQYIKAGVVLRFSVDRCISSDLSTSFPDVCVQGAPHTNGGPADECAREFRDV